MSSVAKGLVMDLAFILEAQEACWLPEQLLAAVRVCKVDMASVAGLVDPSEERRTL